MIRVLVVDDHEVVRAGLRLLLGAFPDIECVAEAGDGAAALERVREVVPDVVLMDLSMPGTDGITATGWITTEYPGVRVVALTTFSDRSHVTGAIDAGACGFLLKDADAATLHEAIRSAHAGTAPLDPRAAQILIGERRDPTPTPGRAAGLTEREREVLALVATGLSNRVVARRLGIAEKTVKAHLTSAFATIGVTDRVQAALWWHAQGR